VAGGELRQGTPGLGNHLIDLAKRCGGNVAWHSWGAGTFGRIERYVCEEKNEIGPGTAVVFFDPVNDDTHWGVARPLLAAVTAHAKDEPREEIIEELYRASMLHSESKLPRGWRSSFACPRPRTRSSSLFRFYCPRSHSRSEWRFAVLR
jgi:hypothetical protein